MTDFSSLLQTLNTAGVEFITDTVLVTAFGMNCRCITLDRLIEVKRAAGRTKDLEAIAELEALREERDRLR